MRLPIRWKLIVGIGVPMLLVYGMVLMLTTRQLRARGLSEMEANMTELAQHWAAKLDGQFRTISQIGLSSAQFLTLDPPLDEAQLYAMLEGNVRQDAMIYGSCIAFEPFTFDPQRRLFAPYMYRRDGRMLHMDVADAYDYTDPKWDWFRIPRETGKPFWTEPFFDDGAGDIVMCTHVTPFFREGHFRGTVNVDLPITELQRRVEFTGSPDAEFFIVSRMGTFVSHREASWVMNESIFSISEKLKRPELAALGRRMVAGESGVTRLKFLHGNEPAWAFFAPIPSTGWSLCAGVPESRVMAFADEQLANGVSALLVGLVLITIVLMLMAATITRPIARLRDAVSQLGAGNFEVRTVSVRSRDEVGDLAKAFDGMLADLRSHVSALTAATAAREKVESELRIAGVIQSSLLPRNFPPFPERGEFDLHAVLAPARHVAGDFFDFFFSESDVLTFIIADVSGKGVPAAMFMAVTRTVLRQLAARTASPGELLTLANDILIPDNNETMFVTIFVGRYEVKTGRLCYANAGHPRPYLIGAGGQVQACGRITGTVLGIVPEMQYGEDEHQIQIGDKLVLYTDGVTEARSPSGEFFRAHRFEALLARHGMESPDALCASVIKHVGEFQNNDPHDDITMLVLARRS